MSLAYFLVALWPMIGGASVFFGPGHRAAGVLLWIASPILLAAPYALAWHPALWPRVFRLAAALLLSALPPLGYVGLASPLSAAGALLPGTGWAGLAVTLLFCLALTARPVPTLLVVLTTLAWFHRHPVAHLPAPRGWEAVDTQFGGAGSNRNKDLAPQFAVVQALQHKTLTSRARVLIFPESIIHRWTLADDAYLRRSFEALRRQHRVVLIGAEVPISRRQIHSRAHAENSVLLPAWNGIVVRGSQSAFYAQRIPVPLGMWGRDIQPYFRGSGTVLLQGRRAGVLICWEQLLVWPVLQSAVRRPDVLLALSNLYWAKQSAIPKIQAVLVEAWAELFGVPYLRAVNV